MGKKILIGVGVVILALAVLIWQTVANLDGIVAGVIEDVGSDVLKTSVTVTGVTIDLKQGKAGIAGLKIANPEGFSSSNLFEMEGVEVDIALNSLGTNVLVIDSIIIQNPKISFEADETGGSNMQTLLDNMSSGSSDDTAAEGTTEESAEGEALKLIVDKLEFSGGQVNATTAAKPGEATEINLPGISMKGVGRKKGGVTPEVVAEKIVKELVDEIIKAAAKAGVNKALEKEKKSFLDRLKGDG